MERSITPNNKVKCDECGNLYETYEIVKVRDKYLCHPDNDLRLQRKARKKRYTIIGQFEVIESEV